MQGQLTRADFELLEIKLANLQPLKDYLKECLGTDKEQLARNRLGVAVRAFNEFLEGFKK